MRCILGRGGRAANPGRGAARPGPGTEAIDGAAAAASARPPAASQGGPPETAPTPARRAPSSLPASGAGPAHAAGPAESRGGARHRLRLGPPVRVRPTCRGGRLRPLCVWAEERALHGRPGRLRERRLRW